MCVSWMDFNSTDTDDDPEAVSRMKEEICYYINMVRDVLILLKHYCLDLESVL